MLVSDTVRADVLIRSDRRAKVTSRENGDSQNEWHSVLVLNQNYEPLNVCNVRRAMVLVIDGKAEVLEEYNLALRRAHQRFASPSVIRLVYMIRRPRPRVKLTRKEIFIRDEHTCQYCGRRSSDLTLDHIHPRSRGGPHTWAQSGLGLPRLQSPQGRQIAGRGPHASAPPTLRTQTRRVLHDRTTRRIGHSS